MPSIMQNRSEQPEINRRLNDIKPNLFCSGEHERNDSTKSVIAFGKANVVALKQIDNINWLCETLL